MPVLNLKQVNTPISPQDTICVFKNIIICRIRARRCYLGHRLWYTRTKRKFLNCSSEKLQRRQHGHSTPRQAESKMRQRLRLSLTWASLNCLGAPAMWWCELALSHLLIYPCALPNPRRAGDIGRAKHFPGILERVWMQDVSRSQFSFLEASLERLQVAASFSQTVLSRQPLGSLNNFLVSYQFKGILRPDMQLQWSLLCIPSFLWRYISIISLESFLTPARDGKFFKPTFLSEIYIATNLEGKIFTNTQQAPHTVEMQSPFFFVLILEKPYQRLTKQSFIF